MIRSTNLFRTFNSFEPDDFGGGQSNKRRVPFWLWDFSDGRWTTTPFLPSKNKSDISRRARLVARKSGGKKGDKDSGRNHHLRPKNWPSLSFKPKGKRLFSQSLFESTGTAHKFELSRPPKKADCCYRVTEAGKKTKVPPSQTKWPTVGGVKNPSGNSSSWANSSGGKYWLDT